MALLGFPNAYDPTQQNLVQSPQSGQQSTSVGWGGNPAQSGTTPIMPGDGYDPGQWTPPDSGSSGPKFPNIPPSRNPWLTPLPRVLEGPYQFGSTDTSGQQGQTGNATNSISNGPFDASKSVTFRQASGLDAAIPKPPANYDEAGGYEQYIAKWQQFMDNLRKSLGIGDQWTPEDLAKFKPIFDQLGIKYQDNKDGGKWSSRIYIPDGRGGYIQVDLRGGQGQYGFVNYGHTEQSGAYAGGGSGSGGGTGGGGTGGGTGGQSFADFLKSLGIGGMGSSPWTGKASDFFDRLMKRADQSLDVNKQDPIIRGQTNAFSAAQDRAMRNFLANQAESAKTPFFNMQGEARRAAETTAQNTSQFQAQLMGQELAARREEIAQALQLGASFLTEQQRLQLQEELGLIDAALRKLGLDQQFDMFMRQLGFNVEQFASQLDLARRGLA